MVVYLQLGQHQAKADYLGTVEVQRNDCTHLQAAIAAVQNTGANSQIELFISSDANVSQDIIRLGSYYCYFRSNDISAQLRQGDVRVKRVNGVVSIENF